MKLIMVTRIHSDDIHYYFVHRMPITVYMHDEDAGGLIAIAEYGQQYGKEDPIQVLYHGFGHYDALQIPAKIGSKRKL